MRAKDIMSTQLVTVGPDAAIASAIALMLANRISGLPVVDDRNRLLGIISESDFLQRDEIGTERKRPRWLSFLLGPGNLSADYVRANARTVGELMTSEVVTAAEDDDLRFLVDLMTRNAIKRIPVVRSGTLVGLVSRADLLTALGKVLPADWPQPARDDADILADIQAEFDREACIPKASIDVAVRDGVVELRGSISDERTRSAVRVAVENTPGVRAIHDHMLWIEPLSGIFSLSPEDAAATRS